MKRAEYIEELTFWLSPLSLDEREEIIADYQEHFEIGSSQGKQEGEIIASLGKPKQNAQLYITDLKDECYSNGYKGELNKEENKRKIGPLGLMGGIIGLILFGPVVFIALPAILFAAIIVAVTLPSSLLFAGGMTTIMSLVGIGSNPFILTMMTMFMGIGLLAFSSLMFICIYWIAKPVISTIKKLMLKVKYLVLNKGVMQ